MWRVDDKDNDNDNDKRVGIRHCLLLIVPFLDKLLGACRRLDCPRNSDASGRH